MLTRLLSSFKPGVPEPKIRAKVDSFLKSFEAPAGAAMGDIVGERAIDGFLYD
jgi:hypothetical protein